MDKIPSSGRNSAITLSSMISSHSEYYCVLFGWNVECVIMTNFKYFCVSSTNKIYNFDLIT